MIVRTRFGLFACLLSLTLLQACGADEDEGENTAGTSGTGGSSSAGTGGGTSAPADLICGDQSCPDLDIMGTTVAACCVEGGGCGIDGSAAAALGVEGLGCVSFSAEIPASGIIEVPGGEPILFDATCPGIAISNPLVPIDLPGCCRSNGQCGGSTHAAQDLPLGEIPLECASNGDVQEFLDGFLDALGFAGLVTAPADPMQACDYTLPTLPATDAGTGEADASTGEPDAGDSLDAGV